jgi:hypothetical protein
MTPVEHIRVEDLPELEKTAAALLAEIESAAMTREELRDRLVKIDAELETIEAKRTEAAHKLAAGDAKAGAVLDALDADERRKRHLRRGVTQHLATVQQQIVAKEQKHGEHRQQIGNAAFRLQGMELQQSARARFKDFLGKYQGACEALALLCRDMEALSRLGQPFHSWQGQLMEEVYEQSQPIYLEQAGWTKPGVLAGYAWQFPVRPLLPPKKG